MPSSLELSLLSISSILELRRLSISVTLVSTDLISALSSLRKELAYRLFDAIDPSIDAIDPCIDCLESTVDTIQPGQK